MPRLTTMYAGASGSHRGNNFMSGGMCNNKWQGLPATRNMRTGPLLTHVRTQAYAPPADRNRIFNALGGAAYTGKIYPQIILVKETNSFAGRKLITGTSFLSDSIDTTLASRIDRYAAAVETGNAENTGCLDRPDGLGYTHYSYLDEFAIYDRLIAKGYTLRTGGSGVFVFKAGIFRFNLPYAYERTFGDGNKGGKIFFMINLDAATPPVDGTERNFLIDLLELISGTGGKCN